MKFLSAEEAKNYQALASKHHTRVAAALARMNVGEAIIIEKGVDWNGKDSPFRIVNYNAKKTGREYEKGRSNDGNGWFVKRVK